MAPTKLGLKACHVPEVADPGQRRLDEFIEIRANTGMIKRLRHFVNVIDGAERLDRRLEVRRLLRPERAATEELAGAEDDQATALGDSGDRVIEEVVVPSPHSRCRGPYGGRQATGVARRCSARRAELGENLA